MATYKPPQSVATAARRGLTLREKFGRGGTRVGATRANQLASRAGVSLDTIGRMVSYFARHEGDKQADGWGDDADPSPGWVAWLLWGGDAGRAWAEGIWERERQEEAVGVGRESDNDMGKQVAMAEAVPMAEAALLFQKEVNYQPESYEVDRSCGNCRWFSDQPDTMPCHLVVNAPTTITRGGLCTRWAVTPDGSTVHAWAMDHSEGNPNRAREGAEPDAGHEAHEAYESAPDPEPPATAQILVEALDMSAITPAQVDREKRTVRQRVIKAGRSVNAKVYPADVLRTAAPLFEGVKTYADHPTPSERRERPNRSTTQLTGWLDNVRFEEDGLYADRHFTSNQAGQDAWSIVQDIVEGRAPASLMGGSINAVGRAKPVRGSADLHVESIDLVHSVDDVTIPAAGGAFLPLVAGDESSLTAALLHSMTFEEFVAARPEYVERLKKQWQKVRLTEEVTAAYQARDTAQAEVEAARAQIVALQEAHATQEAEHARLRDQLASKDADLARKGLEVTLEQLLRRAGLPASWEAELREDLINSDPQKWPDILARERRKVQGVGQAKVAVTGAPRSEHAAPAVMPTFDPRPKPDEDFAAWQRRVYATPAGKVGR